MDSSIPKNFFVKGIRAVPKIVFCDTTFITCLDKYIGTLEPTYKVTISQEKRETPNIKIENNVIYTEIIDTSFVWIEEKKSPDVNIFCLFCNRILKENRFDIPLKFSFNKFNQFITVVTQGQACNESCGYSFCLIQDRHMRRSFETMTRSGVLLSFFEIAYPGRTITKAKDPMKLKIYGGTLSDEEYDNPLLEEEKPSLFYKVKFT